MFCTQCGTQIDPGKKFCKGCGARVGESAAGSAPTPAASGPVAPSVPVESSVRRPQPMPLSPSRDGRGSHKSLIVPAAVAVIILAGAGIYFGSDLMRQPAPTESQITDAPATKVETPVPELAGENNESSAEPSENAQSALFEPIPPQPADSAETARPAPEVAPKPAPRAETPPPSQFKRAGQDARASSRANRRPASVPATRLGANPGIYQTLRATTVFEAPTAGSKIVANIPAGVRVNVVGSTGDWLEVHSRRGNPPGFIRRDDAQFIASSQ